MQNRSRARKVLGEQKKRGNWQVSRARGRDKVSHASEGDAPGPREKAANDNPPLLAGDIRPKVGTLLLGKQRVTLSLRERTVGEGR